MYDSILVPTDGSEHTLRAAAHAEYLAQVFDATVYLLNVVDIDAEAGPFSAGGIGEEYIEQLKDEGQDTVRELETEIDVPALRTEVLTGTPSETILDYTDEHDIDLVVMGTHGRTGVQRYTVGSVAERVLALADVPVITARATNDEQPVDGYDEILLPTDGSEAAAEVVDHALAIAKQSGRRIHVVNVVDASAVASPDLTMSSEALSELESAGEAATERIATRVADAGVDVVSEVRNGKPTEALLDYADEHDIDLIAMGTTGRTGLSQILLGSITKKVVRHADIPVLTVNARETE